MESTPPATDPTAIPAKFTTDVMMTGVQWKYMTHRLPDRRRPVRDDIDKAFNAFLTRLGTVWGQRTKKAGTVQVNANADGSGVAAKFFLHANEVMAIEFDTERIFRGIGEADEIVRVVIEQGGGVQLVRKLAATMAPKQKVVAEIVASKKKPAKKGPRKKT